MICQQKIYHVTQGLNRVWYPNISKILHMCQHCWACQIIIISEYIIIINIYSLTSCWSKFSKFTYLLFVVLLISQNRYAGRRGLQWLFIQRPKIDWSIILGCWNSIGEIIIEKTLIQYFLCNNSTVIFISGLLSLPKNIFTTNCLMGLFCH